MNKIEHLGIAVADAEKAKKIFDKLLNKSSYKAEKVEFEGVSTHFYELGPNKLELLEATGPDSPIAKFLAKNREGFHHVAIAVDNIFSEMGRLKKEGFVFINDKPKEGADNKLIAFIHPKSVNGMSVELCQDKI